jgi:hypothetical protein
VIADDAGAMLGLEAPELAVRDLRDAHIEAALELDVALRSFARRPGSRRGLPIVKRPIGIRRSCCSNFVFVTAASPRCATCSGVSSVARRAAARPDAA